MQKVKVKGKSVRKIWKLWFHFMSPNPMWLNPKSPNTKSPNSAYELLSFHQYSSLAASSFTFPISLIINKSVFTINVLINDKYISAAMATYKAKINSHSQWYKLWRYKMTENKISNDNEQDIYIPQIIIPVITPSNPEEGTASVMIPAYKGKGDPTECGSFSWN